MAVAISVQRLSVSGQCWGPLSTETETKLRQERLLKGALASPKGGFGVPEKHLDTTLTHKAARMAGM